MGEKKGPWKIVRYGGRERTRKAIYQWPERKQEIGRASCRERVCLYV